MLVKEIKLQMIANKIMGNFPNNRGFEYRTNDYCIHKWVM
jgi:hypothetical protein